MPDTGGHRIFSAFPAFFSENTDASGDGGYSRLSPGVARG